MWDPEMIDDMLDLQTDVLGPEDFVADPMTNDKGTTTFPPTYFETLGQNSIKSSRCYSVSMTHQRPRALVGPTAGGKVYEDDQRLMKNTLLRKRIIEVLTNSKRMHAENLTYLTVKHKSRNDCPESPCT